MEYKSKKLAELKAKKQRYMRELPAKRSFMLQGLLRCDTCGVTLCMSSLVLRALQCCQYSHGKCNVSHYVSIQKLDKLVLNSIEQAVLTDNFKLNIKAKTNNSNKDNAISSKIAKEAKKLERVKEAYEDGLYTLKKYKQSKESITANIEKLKSQLSAIKTINPNKERETLRNKVPNILPALLQLQK